MVRICMVIMAVALLSGCGGHIGQMDKAEDPQGRYREQIAAAKRLLEQQEDWADRAEWQVEQDGDGWKVVAWRVEHPDAKGPDRYLPWGYSVIELDSRLVAVHYQHNG
jgi:uncharacterized protein YceK